MARNFKELQAKMSPEQKAQADVRYKKLLADMPLAELREARQMTQTALAEILDVNQPAISKIERQADMYVSTLRTVVEAMGGHLSLQAVFPEGRVEITQFGDSKQRREKERKKAHKAALAHAG